MKEKREIKTINIRMSHKMRDRIDEYKENSGFSTRTQTVIFLIQNGLKSTAKPVDATPYDEKVLVPVKLNDILIDKIETYMNENDLKVPDERSRAVNQLLIKGLKL